MTCFRMENGETVHQWCKKNGFQYNSFWHRMEKGLSFDESIIGTEKAKGKGRSHPKYFYQGKPIVCICGGYKSNLYSRVCRKLRRGISIETALKYEGII